MENTAARERMRRRGVPGRILILDIEATGLQADSCPIEIAYGDPLESWVNSFLIKPHPDWEHIPVTEQAQSLTGINSEMLCSATPANKVAKIVAADLQQADLVLSDSPVWDGRWLKKLLDLSPLPVDVEIKDFFTTINAFNPLRKYLSTHKCLNIFDKSEHRAGGDVIRLLKVFRRALPVPLWEEQYCPVKSRGFGMATRAKFIPGIPE
ncbi:MAG: hypothetical protein HQL69_19560 [Magnetococcales bacterium]|nr:hypothetical protein [Magnetococcales bacterium]